MAARKPQTATTATPTKAKAAATRAKKVTPKAFMPEALLLSKLALNLAETAYVLSLSETTVDRLVRRNVIPSIVIGERNRRIPTHLLRAYIESLSA